MRMGSGVQSSAERKASHGALLAELQAAHANLQKAIDELAKLTEGPVPTKAELVDTRWRVSRASLSRRSLWARIQMTLSAGKHHQDVLRRLQEMDIALLRASTDHVGKWSPEAVLSDWTGYCLASANMRTQMKAAIGVEKQLLYPLLDQLDSPGSLPGDH